MAPSRPHIAVARHPHAGIRMLEEQAEEIRNEIQRCEETVSARMNDLKALNEKQARLRQGLHDFTEALALLKKAIP